MRALLKRALAGLGLLLALTVLALAGLWAGLRLAGPSSHTTTLGQVEIRVAPALRGSLELFVPVADWGLRTRPFAAPLRIQLEPRSLERERLLEAVAGDKRMIAGERQELREAVGSAITRALLWAILGALLVSLLVGLCLWPHARARYALAGAGFVLALSGALVLGTGLMTANSFDSRELAHPTYYARGAELAQLLRAAGRAREAGDSYERQVDQALRGLAALVGSQTDALTDTERSRALLVSDLHDNVLVLDPLREFSRGQTVFFAGDLGESGSATETRLLARKIPTLSRRIVAVSGNHDSLLLMRRLARAGVTVLTARGRLGADGHAHGPAVITAAGLRVAGYSDPLAYRGRNPTDPSRVYSFGDMPDGKARQERALTALLDWYRALPVRPDVVIVHENMFAQALGRAASADTVTILTGHDHKQHITRYGQAVVVDGGTGGAGGLAAGGAQRMGFGELHFSAERKLISADLIQLDPITGAGEAKRQVIKAPDRSQKLAVLEKRCHARC